MAVDSRYLRQAPPTAYYDYAPEELAGDFYVDAPHDLAPGPRIDLLAIAPLVLVVLIAISLVWGRAGQPSAGVDSRGAATSFSAEAASAPVVATPAPPVQPQPQPAAPGAVDPTAFVAPYDSYIITQGVHGQSYGHAAIDIAAGKGAVIKSPIAGEVTMLRTDGVGNTMIVIENAVYQVILLHGIYNVAVGQFVNLGEPLGEESNIGNVTDMQGNSCRNRDCGYHTHLNVFDKRIGRNVNPLDLIER